MCVRFFDYYNHEHRHSGIGLHTPYSVHVGTAPAIQEKRQAVASDSAATNSASRTPHAATVTWSAYRRAGVLVARIRDFEFVTSSHAQRSVGRAEHT